MAKNCFVFFMLLAFIIGLCSCNENNAGSRAEKASKPRGNIHIALAGTWNGKWDVKGLLHGVRLAVKEVNAAGGVDGRLIDLTVKNDKGSLAHGRVVAKEIVEDSDITAVIGHVDHHITGPCSAVYEAAGLLHISPIDSLDRKRDGDKKLFLQTAMDYEDISKSIISYCEEHGYDKIAVQYTYKEYGIKAANSLERVAAASGIVSVVDIAPNPAENASFKLTFDSWKKLDIDAVIVVVQEPDALRRFLKAEKRNNMNMPVIAMNSLHLMESGDAPFENVISIEYFDPFSSSPQVRRFVNEYTKEYQEQPNSFAAQGYEAVMLLVEGMRKAKSAVPDEVASALLSIKNFKGLDGKYSFDDDGVIQGKAVKLIKAAEQVDGAEKAKLE